MRTFQLSAASRAAVLPIASAVFLLGGALAQAQAQTTKNQPGPTATSAEARSAPEASRAGYRAVRASEVIGMKVRNEKGESLGEIGDLVVDMNSGDVRYAILQFDPGLFSAERLFAVPTKELRLGKERNEVIYRMSKERLEQTSINRSDWNRSYLENRENVDRMDRAYGIQQPSQGAKARRVSDLLGKDVETRTGENIGQIEDVVINMAAQKVHYAVLHFDVGWATPDKRVVFPIRSFNVVQGNDDLVLDVDKSKIRSMKDFTKDNYADLGNPVWLVDVDRYLVTLTPVSNDSTGSTGVMGASSGQSPQNQDSQRMAQNSQQQGSQGSKESQGQSAQRSANAGAGSVANSEAMQKLQQSAQRLRESIQAMAQQEPGPKRDQAIDQAHQALRETNATMVALIPRMQSGSSGSSGSSNAAAKAEENAQYDKSVERLKKAADSLRQSIQAMAKQPAGEARNRAIEQANSALWETQEAMIAAYQQRPGRNSQTMGAGEKQR